MPSKVWDEITYPFPNFNGATVEVWEWISNFIPHFMMNVITYPCYDFSRLIYVNKRFPRCSWWSLAPWILAATSLQQRQSGQLHAPCSEPCRLQQRGDHLGGWLNHPENMNQDMSGWPPILVVSSLSRSNSSKVQSYRGIYHSARTEADAQVGSKIDSLRRLMLK